MSINILSINISPTGAQLCSNFVQPAKHHIITRSKIGSLKPKYIFTLLHPLTLNYTPMSYNEATKWPQWNQGMLE